MITKKTWKNLMPLMSSVLDRLQGEYGQDDDMVTEVREMYEHLQAGPSSNKKKSAISKALAAKRSRDKNGHFVKT